MDHPQPCSFPLDNPLQGALHHLDYPQPGLVSLWSILSMVQYNLWTILNLEKFPTGLSSQCKPSHPLDYPLQGIVHHLDYPLQGPFHQLDYPQ